MSILEYYRPTKKAVMAVIVTPHNAMSVAAELGGELVEFAKPSDPRDVGTFLLIPTLSGVKKISITEEGFVAGREVGTGKVLIWESVLEFETQYAKSKRDAPNFRSISDD